MRVDTVVFDAGRTLLRIVPSFQAIFLRGCRRAGIELAPGDVPSEALARAWREHEQAWEAGRRPSPHTGDPDAEREFWQGLYRRVLARIGADGEHARAAAAVHRAFLAPGVFGPYPDVPGALDTLAARGVRLGVLSNWGPELRRILTESGLVGRFDAVVVSAEEGVAKPDPRLFRLALDRLGAEPGPDVAYVGDDPRLDIEPSRRLGLTAVLVDRDGRHPEHEGLRITSLAELPEVLPLRAAATG